MKYQTVSLQDFIWPRVPNEEGRISSRVIARYFEKRHGDVLRSIQNLDCDKEFDRRNFASRDYTDDRGKKYPEILMTRDGCLFLIMGYTGKKAAKIKQELLLKFRIMEKKIIQQDHAWWTREIARRSRLHTAVQISPVKVKKKTSDEAALDNLREMFGV